jgi:hypothetical protein
MTAALDPMLDSLRLTVAKAEGERTVWLYRLEDGSIHVSEVDPDGETGDIPRGLDLMIPAASVDRLAFALLAQAYRGRAGVIEELRDLLAAENIPHTLDRT